MKMTRKELTSEEHIIGTCSCGVKPVIIVKAFGFPLSAIYDIVNRYKQSGSAQLKASPGRLQILNDCDQRVVKRTMLVGCHRSLGEITNEVNARLDMDSCQSTVQSCMAMAIVFLLSRLQKNHFKKKNVESRLEGCKKHQKWDKEWKKVVFL